MRHCVFCASLERCENEVKVASWVAESLEQRWDVEHDIVLCAYHSKVSCMTGHGNAEIYLENEDVHQLIADCMEFAVEYARIKSK